MTADERGAAAWAVVPVKSLACAKSRLAPLLTPQQRRALNVELLRRILQVLSRVELLDGVLVVSSDDSVLSLAEEGGAVGLREQEAGLNQALAQATDWVRGRGGSAVLILPVDLPLLQAEDVREILLIGKTEPVVVISPCRRNDGTNALLVRPPGLIEYSFGLGSFALHSRQAEQKGAALCVYRSPRLGLDLDLPEDVYLLRQILDASI